MAALHSTGAGGLFRTGGDARDQEIARLSRELETAQLRMEEVAVYYRGELEALRRRAEEEAVRVQAAEAGRRKRAEEQVVYLKAEYKSARAEADHVLRRYQELQQSLDELERHNEQHARAEVDRYREAAKVAWKTAEEEVERLDGELCELRRQIEREREERRQLERSHEQQEESRRVAEQDRNRLMGRLKRALKLSEERRQRLEASQTALGQETAGLGGVWSSTAPAGTTVEVDPAAGWGDVRLASSGELNDEFLRIEEDQSLDDWFVDEDPCEPETETISDSEAETLMMELDVAEKVEQRQAVSAARRSLDDKMASGLARPPSLDSSPGLSWKWLLLMGAMAAFAVAVAIIAF